MTHTPPASPPALIGVLRAISDGAAAPDSETQS